MPRLNLYSLRLQISRMYEQGQSFFCLPKVQDWLRQRNEDPAQYDIIFHSSPAPPESGLINLITIELKRKDGQPVDDWLQTEINRYTQ